MGIYRRKSRALSTGAPLAIGAGAAVRPGSSCCRRRPDRTLYRTRKRVRVGRNGAALLQPVLEPHAPINLLIIFLGTNDRLDHSQLTAMDAAHGVECLAKIALASETDPSKDAPKIMIISPPRIRACWAPFGAQCPGDPSRSKDFGPVFQELAVKHNCFFLDAARFVEPSPVDGVHRDDQTHRRLGTAIATEVAGIASPGCMSVANSQRGPS